jgi:thioredoxin
VRIEVEIFSAPGCIRCGEAKAALRKVVEEIGGGRIAWREVNVVDELDYAVKLGVLSTPAIVVNGRLVFAALPSAKKLRAALENEIRKSFSTSSGQN